MLQQRDKPMIIALQVLPVSLLQELPMLTTKKYSWIRKYPKTITFVFVIFSVLFLDLVGTGIYHLAKYGTIHKYEYLRVMRVKDPIYHHTLKPNAAHTYEKWGGINYTLITNALGFKDRETRDVPLDTGTYRIVFIGDSFTEGMGYNYNDTFVGQIDKALGIKKIQVLNAGVASYSPVIYFKKIDYLLGTVGLKFDELVVFLDISDIHDDTGYDIINNKVVSNQPPNPFIAMKDFFYEYTMIPRNLWSSSAKLYRKLVKDPDSHPRSKEDHSLGVNTYRSLWTIDESIYAAYGELGLKKCRQHMDLLYDLLTEQGIKMSIAIYPQPDQILHNDLDSRQVKVWKNWAEKHSLQFFNFFPDFVGIENEPKETIRKYFIHGDLHWNDQGHNLIASKFLEQWKSHRDSSKNGL